jgi:hypothetical protein
MSRLSHPPYISHLYNIQNIVYITKLIVVNLCKNVTLKQATKGVEGSRGIALLILNLGARRVWMVSTTPRPLYPL